MKKANKLLIFIPNLLIIGCSLCPNQLFVASGVNGNSCCNNRDLVIISKDTEGKIALVNLPLVSPTPTPITSPTSSPSPVPVVSPSAPAPSPSVSNSPAP